MTSRFILILLAMMWSAFAAAAEVVNEPEQSNQWLTPPSTQISSDEQATSTPVNKQTSGNTQKQQTNKNERSRLGGMFDLLLPSGLRDNQ
ncbi:MAG: hypothetical protein OQK49_08105 [Proteobacteria bacterium]|nr:hypothetical protein [Pseudomonadota bacterium]